MVKDNIDLGKTQGYMNKYSAWFTICSTKMQTKVKIACLKKVYGGYPNLRRKFEREIEKEIYLCMIFSSL